jgi:chromosome partitioning protein
MPLPVPRITAVVNQKGGVGKTTTAVNLATALAAVGQKVLLVDSDPQANAGSAFGIWERDPLRTSYRLTRGVWFPELARQTLVPGLDLVPAHQDLYGAEIELVHDKERERKYRQALEKAGGYDDVIVDCPPGLGVLSLNALVAASHVLVPVQCEYYALEGLSKILSTIEIVRKNMNPRLKIAGLLMTMFDRRSLHCQMICDDVRQNLGHLVFDTVVPRNITITEAHSFGKPVLLYDHKSKGAQAYIHFAKEFLERLSGHE